MNLEFQNDIAYIRENFKDNPGYIYLIRNKTNEYKIGITINIKQRLASFQTANSDKLVLVNFAVVQDRKFLEKYLHKKFQCQRQSGEWFALSDSDIKYVESIFRALYFRKKITT